MMNEYEKIENRIAKDILNAAFIVHNALGPGLLESVYEKCLAYELEKMGHKVACQVPMPLTYKELSFDTAFRVDILVNDLVIVEVKAVESLPAVSFSQTLTYLKMTEKKLGLLINFNTKYLKNGIHRIANNL